MPDATPQPAPAPPPTARRLRAAAPLSLLLLALLAYFPALDNNFVGWDDGEWVYDNANLAETAGLRRAWSFSDATPYFSCPLTFTSFWLEYRLWKLDPRGYHLTNVLLHALSALLTWRLLRALGLGRGAAWFAAALFAVHPMQVQSVAWITERKNVLSQALLLGSMLLYLRHRRRESWTALSACLVLFAAASLAKAAAVVLPLLLLWTEWTLDPAALRTRPLAPRALAARLAPLLLLAAAIAFLATRMEDPSAGRPPPLLNRILVAGAIPWFYAGKLLFPVTLMPLYPRWNVAPADWRWSLPLTALLLAVALLVALRPRLPRYLVWGLGFFLIGLLPMLGLVHYVFFDYAYVSDHYVYLSGVGLFVALAALIESAARRLAGAALRPVLAAVALALVAVLAAQTWQRCQLWRTTHTIMTELLRHNSDFWMAWGSLGDFYRDAGDLDRAAEHYRRALELDSRRAGLHNNLANLQARTGDLAAALDGYRRAIALDESYPQAHVNLGALLARLGRHEEALAAFDRALALAADRRAIAAVAQRHRGDSLRRLGRLDEALDALNRAAALAPDSADVLTALGVACAAAGRDDDALDAWQRALARDAACVDAANNLGAVLARRGLYDAAAGQLEHAAALAPDRADVLLNLAGVRQAQRRHADERDALQRACQLPTPPLAARTRLARLLASCPDDAVRDGPRALQLAQQVVAELGDRSAQAFDLLGCALAEVGRFDEAQAALRTAIDLARRSGNDAQTTEYRRRLTLFENRQPFRDAAAPSPAPPD